MSKNTLPSHVAIILDGNGRWAKRKGLPRTLGHYQGALNLFNIAKEASLTGINLLTVYAFSTENWKRPKPEVDYLMTEPLKYLNKYEHKLKDLTYNIKFVGRRDKLPLEMLEVVNRLESLTKEYGPMTLQIALDYGSKDELINAFSKASKPYTEKTIQENLYVREDVDLLIRTSGEERLSNFLLWQSAYAEIIFVKKHWPAFKTKDFKKALKKYAKRNRRFGGLSK